MVFVTLCVKSYINHKTFYSKPRTLNDFQMIPELIETSVMDSLREQLEVNTHGIFKDDFIIHLQKVGYGTKHVYP